MFKKCKQTKIKLTNCLPSQTKWGKGGVVIPGGGIIKPGGETWDLVESLEFSCCAAADFKSSCCFNKSRSFAWSEKNISIFKKIQIT